MAESPRSLPLWRRLLESPVVLSTSVVVVMVAQIAVPLMERPRRSTDAASNARLAYRALRAQIDAGRSTVGVADTSATESTATADKLQRDLFKPARPTRSAGNAGASAAKPKPKVKRPPKPPQLTGIFIDGAEKRAVIGGQVVRQGDVVKGFTVVEIHRDWVLLRKGKTVERLRLGGAK